MQHNDDLRRLLARHFTDWTVLDTEVRMEVRGTIKARGVTVTVNGFREDVAEVLQSLVVSIATRKVSE